MPEAKRPLKVFLCHAHADREPVRALYKRLTDDGVDAWFDKEKLLPGQDWELEIRKAVREADVVVVCLSKQFNQAGFRQKEVRLALDTAMEKPEGDIFIIPARLEECDNLESLRKWHEVNLFEEGGYELLLRALRARAEKVGVTLHKARNKPQAPRKQAVPQKMFGDFVSSLRNLFPLFRIAGIIAAIGLLIWGGSLALPKVISLLPTPKATSTQGHSSPTMFPAQPVIPTQTNRPVATQVKAPARTSTPTQPSLSTQITDDKGAQMVLVPDGKFIMGSDSDAHYSDVDQKPAHDVFLDSFYIDQYEVTNKLYAACVDAGGCTKPHNRVSNTRSIYYGNSEFDSYPVIYVDWYQANAYCEWRGARLPTEAEWEKAARGTDGRAYPWGDFGPGLPTSGKANYAMGDYYDGDTTAVTSNPDGVSIYGAYNMAGNVWEWVNDWYKSDYYATLGNNSINPQGPSQGDSRVLRGGSFSPRGVTEAGNILAYNRFRDYPSAFYQDTGFRCARSTP